MSNENKQLAPAQAFGLALSGKYDDRITSYLGDLVSKEKFIQSSIMALEQNPDLGNNPPELMKAVFQCAKDGLLPDGQEAALVPFGNKITYMPMVKGVIKMITRAVNVKTLIHKVVMANDEFEQFTDEDGDHFKHVPARADRGAMEGCYALILTIEGGRYFLYMDKSEIDKRKSVSKNQAMWTKWPNEMWEKTVLHKIKKNITGEDGSENEEAEIVEQPVDIKDRAEEQERVVNNIQDDEDFEIPENNPEIKIGKGTF